MPPPPTSAASLDELALRHRTDKSSRQHDYAGLYDRHLAALRDAPVTVLEIGVQDGASLRMWRDYFPRGRIFGIDVDPACARHSRERVEVMIGSQRDTAFLDSVVARTGPLDLVVDDGSHRFADQRRALMRLWPHVKPGGTYIVEDTHTSYWARFGMSYRQRDSTVELLKDLVDDIHHDLHEHRPTLPDVGRRPVRLLHLPDRQAHAAAAAAHA